VLLLKKVEQEVLALVAELAAAQEELALLVEFLALLRKHCMPDALDQAHQFLHRLLRLP
jgi:hypothetical protein